MPLFSKYKFQQLLSVREGERTIGRAIAYSDQDPKQFTIGAIMIQAEDQLEIRKELIRAVIDAAKARGCERYRINLGGEHIDQQRDAFTELGFQCETVFSIFEKQI